MTLKRTFLVIGAALLTACRPIGSVKKPADYLPFVSMGLEAAATAAEIGKTESVRRGAFSACVTTSAVSSAFQTASEAVASASRKQPKLPAVEVDVTDCLLLTSADKAGLDLQDDLRKQVHFWTDAVVNQSVFFLHQIKATNCKGYQTGIAALAYVEATVDPVYDEVSNPDGKLLLPAQEIDFSRCEG